MIMVIKSIYSLQMKGNIRLDQLRKRDENYGSLYYVQTRKLF